MAKTAETKPRKPSKNKGGRPKSNNSQRSIRMPNTAWDKLDELVDQINADPDRDPLLEAVNVTVLVNMAVRDLFEKHGIKGGFRRSQVREEASGE